jgi:dihydrofolate synthase/folylpolyglutamate synthase
MTTSETLLAELKRLHPLLIDLSLGRVTGLLAKLGDPHRRLPPVVHIAGTNGKGSTTAYLKAMLEAAGRRVHTYTSPHLVRFNERIALAGAGRGGRSAPIAEDRLVELLGRVARINAGAPVTFFEITTAAAFLAFAETPADAVLLEVGLGGRLDATNVVERPRLAVITPVSMDHADKLGATLALIAGEKAGILKPGVTAIISAQREESRTVIEARGQAVGARLRHWGADFEAFRQGGRMVFQAESRLLDLPLPALIGEHQIVNAGCAVAAALELAELGLDERAIERGLLEVEWPARMQRLANGPLARRLGPGTELWLDGGHNPDGGRAIAATLAALEERASKPLHLVVGMMGQKDAAGFLEPFVDLARSVRTVPVPGAHEAPFAPEALAALAASLGLRASAAPGVEAALDEIERVGRGPKRVLITGSLYLAGSVLAREAGVTPQSN